MELIRTVILAVIQGLTEFLPISSSAHLILVPVLLGWPDQGLAFDVALNTATWLALVLYFRRDLASMARGFIDAASSMQWRGNRDARLALMVLGATVPVGAAGLLAHDVVAYRLRTIEVIAVSSVMWGAVLWFADRRPGTKDVHGIGWTAALVVGLAQAMALVPGTSRSGITITAGLFMGLSRTGAARFSFLLAVVVGALAGAKELAGLIKMGVDAPWSAIGTGFMVAFFSAYLAIHYFLRFISRSSMTPFVIYRILLGIVLLAISRYN